MKTPTLWTQRHLLNYLLMPASWLYWFASHIRRLFTKTRKADIPVICVGNAVAGGAGKTPVALALADLLSANGKSIFFISRGYGGRIKQSTRVDIALHSAQDVGDEALLLAARLPTVIGVDRVKSAALAVQQGAEIIIMDDGFQNPSLHKDISLLVIDATYGAGNGLLMPAGPLREPVDTALARADAVVLMQAHNNGNFVPLHPAVVYSRLEITHPQDIQGKKCVAFAGIARPEKFFTGLRAAGAEVIGEYGFADHHAFTEAELSDLLYTANKQQALLVTTAKDAVKIPPHLLSSIKVVHVRAVFHQTESLLKLFKNAGIL